jgi:predicted ATPase/DNA-binding SARP family transcriptional activator
MKWESHLWPSAVSDRASCPLTLRLFGPFEVCVNGAPLPRLRARKAQWLLALLTLYAHRDVERAWLAGTLWPDSPEPQAFNNLRVNLSDLRRALGPEAVRLHAPTAHTLRLDLSGAEADLLAFDRAIACGEIPALEQAAALYRGPLLEGCPEPWAFQERQAREQAYLDALERLASHAMATGDPAAAERYLRRAAAADPLRETTQRTLMQALAAGGNSAGALQVYRELRLLLHREIHAQPDPETRALIEKIRTEARGKADGVVTPADGGRREQGVRRGDGARKADGATGSSLPGAKTTGSRGCDGPRGRTLLPPGRSAVVGSRRRTPCPPSASLRRVTTPSPRRPVATLPCPLTSFIGREPQIAEIRRLLQAHRLVTLNGAGGCGKTRLALHVAGELVDEYAGSVWLVEFASLADPALVPQAVATALGVREEPDQPLVITLTRALCSRQLLLVLDNCEHLVDACAHLAEALLRACPHLKIVATSREALGIAGETPFRVPSLSLPDEAQLPPWERLLGYEAVRLFIERAALVRPGFVVTSENAASVVAVCQRLDGIPLAIELAAAWVRALPVQQIAQRLDDRFHLLTGGSRTALPRHRTLQALIDWSYDLLAERERALLRRLSVFAGGWMLAAAEAVCSDGADSVALRPADVLELLVSLVDQSLVVYEERGAEARYRLLETVRLYGRDRLAEAGEAEVMRGRHRDWFLALAEGADAKLYGGEQNEWLQRLEREHDNLRTAFAWCQTEPGDRADGDEAPAGLRMAVALVRFGDMRGYLAEDRARLAAALALPGARVRTSIRAKALNAAAWYAKEQGDFATSRSLYEESLAISRELGNRRGVADSLNGLAFMTWQSGSGTAPRPLFAESLAIRRELDDQQGVAETLYLLGFMAWNDGDFAAARSLHEESLAIRREVGDQFLVSWSLLALGHVARWQGDFATARSYYEESLAMQGAMGAKTGIAHSHANLGHLARLQTDYEAARSHYQQAIGLFQEVALRGGEIPMVLDGFAALAAAEGQAGRAARLFGAAEALRDALHSSSVAPVDRPDYERAVAAARSQLAEAAFAAAWAAGRAMPLDAAVTFALEDTSASSGAAQ